MQIEFFGRIDIPDLLAHGHSVGWYQQRDWECFVDNGIVFGHRTEKGKIVSSAVVLKYGPELSWLTGCVVNPAFQGQGLGNEIMKSVMRVYNNSTENFAFVTTAEAKPLYEKNGFKVVSNTSKFISDEGFSIPTFPLPKGYKIRPYEHADFQKICELDYSALAADRKVVIEYRLKQSSHILVLEDSERVVCGFIFGAVVNKRQLLGPIIAPDTQLATSLIAEISKHGSGSMRIDLTGWQSQLSEKLIRLGFSLDNIWPIMSYQEKRLFESPFYFGMMAQSLG
ncbi:MAG: GNAT family N-acetyltransferase [Pseudobdellovibrionaceae bacterium]